MKPLFISELTVLILTFSSLLFSQQLHVALLNQNTVDYVEPLNLEVSPFDQVKFMATGGDFEITIHNANEIFNVDSDEIRIKLT